MLFVAYLPFNYTLLIRLILKWLIFLNKYQLAEYSEKLEESNPGKILGDDNIWSEKKTNLQLL